MTKKNNDRLMHNGLVVTVWHNSKRTMDIGVNGEWFRVYCSMKNWKKKTNNLLEIEGYKKGIMVA